MRSIFENLKNFSKFKEPTNGGVHLIAPIVKKHTFGVVVGICTHRNVYLPVLNTIRLLEKCPDPKITVAMGIGDALISRSRSKLATTFMLERDEEILWFQDDDVVGETVDLTRMMWQMKKLDLDILAAPYPLKTLNDAKFAVRTLNDKDEFVVGKGGEIQPMRYVSTGCMGIKRKVFEAMLKGKAGNKYLCERKEIKKDDGSIVYSYEPINEQAEWEIEPVPLCHEDSNPIYPFFNTMWRKLNDKWIFLSEDWAFCQRALDLGFKIWCDYSVRLEHIGEYRYTWDDFFLERNKREGFIHKVDIQKE